MENKFKKLGVVFMLFFAIFVFAYFSFAKNGEKGGITQGELAKILTERMDLDVAKGASTKECFTVLEKVGVKPTGAWEENKPVSREDLGNVLVGAGRLQAEVLGGKDVQTVLKERGIILPKEVNKKTLEDVLKDQNVNILLETPATAISGPSIPYPKQELLVTSPGKFTAPSVEVIAPPSEVTQPPTQPAPPEETTKPPAQLPPITEPPKTEQQRPSGGGAQ